MRSLIFIVIAVAVVGGFVAHRSESKSSAATPTPAPQIVASAKTAATPSAHNWAKSALDRANETKRQVLEQRKANAVN